MAEEVCLPLYQTLSSVIAVILVFVYMFKCWFFDSHEAAHIVFVFSLSEKSVKIEVELSSASDKHQQE